MKLKYFKYVMILLCELSACKPRRADTGSSTKTIFNPQQRADISDKPFSLPIAAVEAGCTAFVLGIDGRTGVAMSAHHCGLKEQSRICLNASEVDQAISPAKCAPPTTDIIPNHAGNVYEGSVDRIIEFSETLDYTIFRFILKESFTGKYDAYFKLMPPNGFDASLKSSPVVTLVGYPSDIYAKGKRTVSFCKVRSKLEKTSFDADFIAANGKALEFYKRQVSIEQYQEANEACGFEFWAKPPPPISFKHDCSVYGGNSGGPLYISEERSPPIVIGLPASYDVNPDELVKCDEYWKKDLRPALLQQGVKQLPEKYSDFFSNWNRADRDPKIMPEEYLPIAAPMSVIVEQSRFFGSPAGRQYIWSSNPQVSR